MEQGNEALYRKGTHVYFSNEVTEKSMLQLTELVYEARDEAVEATLRIAREQYLNNELTTQTNIKLQPRITLYVNSYGGSTHSALSMVHTLQTLRVPVWTVVNGAACSAATLISLAGERRFITATSMMLIHQHSTWFYGTYQQLKDAKRWDDSLYKTLVKYYHDRTHLSKKALRKRLKHDWFMNAQTCLEDGFVDEVINYV